MVAGKLLTTQIALINLSLYIQLVTLYRVAYSDVDITILNCNSKNNPPNICYKSYKNINTRKYYVSTFQQSWEIPHLNLWVQPRLVLTKNTSFLRLMLYYTASFRFVLATTAPSLWPWLVLATNTTLHCGRITRKLFFVS